MRHRNYKGKTYFYYDENGEIQEIPSAAIKFSEFIRAVMARTDKENTGVEKSTGIKCWKRPKRKPCKGIIQSMLDSSLSDIHWRCPVCGVCGNIVNNKKADIEEKVSAVSLDEIEVKNEYKDLQGRIEFDSRYKDQLPKIKTKDKEYDWLELGKRLMVYEGFNIKIQITKKE